MGFIFDINEYGVLSLLLENDLENVPCHSLGYINVGGGWGYGGKKEFNWNKLS